MENFWSRVNVLVRKKNIPLKEIALSCNCHQAVFSKSKSEHTPNLLIAANIAKYLNTTVDFLVNGNKDDTKPFLVEFSDEYTIQFEKLPMETKKQIIKMINQIKEIK